MDQSPGVLVVEGVKAGDGHLQGGGGSLFRFLLPLGVQGQGGGGGRHSGRSDEDLRTNLGGGLCASHTSGLRHLALLGREQGGQ